MANYTSEVITRTLRRWIVPAAEASKAWTAVERAYRKHFGVPDDRTLHDDALRFHVRDGEVVIEFVTEAPSSDSQPGGDPRALPQ